MKKIICVALMYFSFCYGDDIYFKNGFVMHNVQVVDTTNDLFTYIRDGQRITTKIEYVLKVEHRELLPSQKSVYELFSQEIYDQYMKNITEMEIERQEREAVIEASRMALRVDSLQKKAVILDSLHSWRRSLYIAGGWGMPLGYRVEVGVNFRNYSFAVSCGGYDTWSGQPSEEKCDIIGRIHSPTLNPSFSPYVSLGTGSTVSTVGFLLGFSDTYTLLNMGAMVKLTNNAYLRPELGIVWTSKFKGGGINFFGPDTPINREYKTSFGANLLLEFDLSLKD